MAIRRLGAWLGVLVAVVACLGVAPVVRGAPMYTLVLVSSAEIAEPGDTVTLTATITLDGTPVTSGNVAFDANYGTITNVSVDASGQASIDFTPFAGTNHWTAHYTSVSLDGGSDLVPIDVWGRPTMSLTLTLTATSIVATHPGWARADMSPWYFPVDVPTAVTFHDNTTGLDLATIDSPPTPALDLSTLAPGVHEIVAVYPDNPWVHGTTSDPATITVLPDTKVEMSAPTISATSLYPYHDGYRDSVTARFYQSEPLRVRWEVRHGTTVVYRRDLGLDPSRGKQQLFTWTGRSSTGAVVAAGTYTIRLTVRDVAGNAYVKSWTISVSSKRLYWHTVSSQSKAGGRFSALGWGGDGNAYRGGSYSGGARVTAGSYGWGAVAYTFTLPTTSVPSNAVLRRLTWYVNGSGRGTIGIWDRPLGAWTLVNSYDPTRAVGTAHTTYGVSTTATSAHLYGRTFHGVVFTEYGTFNIAWVKVVYAYATLG